MSNQSIKQILLYNRTKIKDIYVISDIIMVVLCRDLQIIEYNYTHINSNKQEK